jgi:hypothetical protein
MPHQYACQPILRVRPDAALRWAVRLLRDVATVFPIHHLDEAILRPVIHTHGSGIAGSDLLIVAAWSVAALLIATRAFRWSPLAD